MPTTASATVLGKPNMNVPFFLLLAELHMKNQKVDVNFMLEHLQKLFCFRLNPVSCTSWDTEDDDDHSATSEVFHGV